MDKVETKLNQTQTSLQQIKDQKKKQDQKLMQQTQEESNLRQKVEKFHELSQELSVVKDKLKSQVQLAQQMEQELKKDKSNIKEANSNNIKMSHQLHNAQADYYKVVKEFGQKDNEVENMTIQLNATRAENRKVKQDIVKLHEEHKSLLEKINI